MFAMHNGRKYSITPKGYLRNNPMGLLHRVIWEEHYGKIPEGKFIDHINHKRDDNRIENLQLLSHGDNVRRSAKGTVSYKGDKYKSRPYYARRFFKGKLYAKLFGTEGGAWMFCNTCLL